VPVFAPKPECGEATDLLFKYSPAKSKILEVIQVKILGIHPELSRWELFGLVIFILYLLLYLIEISTETCT